MWGLGGGLVLALLIVAGCQSNDGHLKPPKYPEEYVLPPDDSRYSQPVAYPKELLDKDILLQRAADAKNFSGPGGPGGPSMGPRSPGSRMGAGGY
jgi:hypothetical protein